MYNNCITSTQPIENYPSIKVFPNPTKGILQFENNSRLNFDAVQILTVDGKQVKHWEQISATTLDVSTLAAGIYFVKLSSTTGVKVFKKIILE